MQSEKGGREKHWLRRLAELPREALRRAKAVLGASAAEGVQLASAPRLRMKPQALLELRQRLERQLQQAGTPLSGGSPPAGPAETALVDRIMRRRDADNRNNVSRTAAYWDMYQRNPELEWAFLAHMVSRNGGWNMTDLQGGLLPHVLDGRQREQLFEFLERANALIFRDAYPQLLLYEESVKAGRPLFHLLPRFGVSQFMRFVWESFWRHNDPVLLTVGLIVNEQSYIEGRVVGNRQFREEVLEAAYFRAQSLLQLNQVVFPYWSEQNHFVDLPQGKEAEERAPRLAGLILENFASLRERIEFGKKLYAILFAIPAVREGARRFAAQRKHTGSRSDYWPHRFAALGREAGPSRTGTPPQERLDGIRLRPGAAPIYSPPLGDAWPDRPVAVPEEYDWCADLTPLKYMTDIEPPASYDMTDAYAAGLRAIELAARAGRLLE